jgi:DNA-binding IclR family transcriptional regulator
MSIARLASGHRMSRQAITKHLQVMERAGLVRGHRNGRENIWELKPAALAKARGYLEQISTQWDAALERLRRLVEE